MFMDILGLTMEEYIISPLFILLLIGGLIGIFTLFFLQRFREMPGVRYWQIWQLATIIWNFTYAFEFAATNLETKIFWSKLSYFGIVFCPVSFFFFSLEFSSQYKWLKKKLIISVYALAAFFIVSPLTNDFHFLHWKSYSINPITNATDYVYGPFFWIIFVFSYLGIVGGIINIILLFFKMSGFYKRQITLLAVASLLPPMGNLIYVFHINPVPGFDWTPFTFLLTGVLIAINISQYKMFDLVPFARNKLIDMIPDSILIVDKWLRIADYNVAMKKLINPRFQEIIGQPVEKIFPNREKLIREIVVHDDFHARISWEEDGETRYFDLHATSLSDQNKQQNGHLIILKDITPHVLAEEKAKDANKRLKVEIQEKEKLIVDLDAFSHTVAHDLKNMLGAIVTASNLIKTGVDDLSKEDLLEINELISLSATKTMHVTRELLTLASVRQQEIRPVPVNMQKIVADSASRLKDMIQEKNAQLVFPEAWPEVLGNEAWLEEAWVNYLSNALKYGGTPPVIELGYDLLPGNLARCWIKDNGKGLSADEMSLLFNKFTRLDTLRAEGHGLGLSIVKRIIEKLDGEVGVESQNIPSQGSTFYFILPLAKS
jgi:PAS domain S-box-containing protein